MAGIKVRDLAFVRFGAPDLDEMARFGADFGFQPARRDGVTLYLRGTGPQPYLHVTHEGPPGFLGVAFDAGSVDALQAFARAYGLPVQALDGPGGGQVVKLTDPDGFGVELVAGFAPAAPVALPEREAFNVLDRYARRNTVKRIGQGPSTVMRLGHCVLNVTDFRRSEAWYKERFGFITSDEVQLPDGMAAGAFMRCDRGAQPSDHHAMFLFGLAPRGFNHAAFEVADIDDVMRGHDHLLRQGRKQDWGVGRHILGSQVFDYWLDPWGHGLEHWTDGDQMDAAWGSRTAPMQDLLNIQWGQAFPGVLPPLPGAAP
jgi:catechol 2,3-dioxygenase-like lactoylglutathione lyase family enzyme